MKLCDPAMDTPLCARCVTDGSYGVIAGSRCYSSAGRHSFDFDHPDVVNTRKASVPAAYRIESLTN